MKLRYLSLENYRLMKVRTALFHGAVIALMGGLPVFASADDLDCRRIISDVERLACYDRISRTDGVSDPLKSPDKATAATHISDEKDRKRNKVSALTDSWELDTENKRGSFVLRPYKPIYILPISYTDNVNQTPSSSSPGHAGVLPINLDATEAKFQFSLKTKLMENLIGDNGDLWLGYTQSSRWQVYNNDESRPFRETNYEPEAMLVFRTNYELFGFKGTMASIGLNHQSNGRAQPLSRDWNRIVAQIGLERDDWMVMLRPWWRLPVDGHSDDNPDIENYIGRGEITVARKWEGHVFSLQARHSLRGGDDSRGSAQLAWSFPLTGGLKGYVQLFSGYGESLIDYNHRQTVLGLGFSVVDWY